MNKNQFPIGVQQKRKQIFKIYKNYIIFFNLKTIKGQLNMYEQRLNQQQDNFINCDQISSVDNALRAQEIEQLILLKRVLEYSQQQQFMMNKKANNCLPLKYRKMIPNMKMKKSTQSCTICLQRYSQGQLIKKLPCGHIIHRQCAKQWLKINKKCPVCRYNLEEHFIKVQLESQKKQKTEKQMNQRLLVAEKKQQMATDDSNN